MDAIGADKYGPPEVLQMKKVPIPKPGPGQILVRVKACGVNPIDTLFRSGSFRVPVQFPWTPGSDHAGLVEEVGSGITKFKKGDRVFGFFTVTGSYAQYTLVEEKFVYPLSDKLTFEEGAATAMGYFTAYTALFLRGHAKSGENLLIHGASGSVGSSCCQIAKHYGLTVYGTAGTEEGLSLIKANGVTHAFNHHDKDYISKIKAVLGDGRLDLIIEMKAIANLSNDIDLISPKGRIIVVGGSKAVEEIDQTQIKLKDVNISCVSVMNNTDDEYKEAADYICECIDAGVIKPLIEQVLPLSDAAQSHISLTQRGNKGAKGKIVLHVTH